MPESPEDKIAKLEKIKSNLVSLYQYDSKCRETLETVVSEIDARVRRLRIISDIQ